MEVALYQVGILLPFYCANGHKDRHVHTGTNADKITPCFADMACPQSYEL